MPEHLLLVRHGESVWNAVGRWQGWADPPLSDLGEAQALGAAQLLVDTGLTAVTASDLQRARHTAEIIADRLGLAAVAVEPGLREFDVGEWTGLTRVEIAARWHHDLEAWNEGRLDRMPGGETREDFRRRLITAMGRVADSTGPPGGPPGRVLVVTHGGVIRALEREAGIDPVRTANLAGRWFGVEAGSRIVAADQVSLAPPAAVAAEVRNGSGVIADGEADSVPPRSEGRPEGGSVTL